MKHEAYAKRDASRIDLLLTDCDLEKRTARARSSWQKMRLLGNGPPFIRLGRLVRYREAEFNAWLAAHPSLRSTSDAAGLDRATQASLARRTAVKEGA